METQNLNIYQRLALITEELQTVGKNLVVQQTKNSSYKAVSERDILDAVKPLEAKYGVYSYPVSRSILESNMLETVSSYQGQETKKTTFMTRIATVYRFVNIDNPSEWVETTTFAEGIDSQDKGSGKAMTYSDKYALMKMYKISTGDDPDQDPSDNNGYAKSAARSPQKPTKSQPVQESAPPPPAPPVAPTDTTEPKELDHVIPFGEMAGYTIRQAYKAGKSQAVYDAYNNPEASESFKNAVSVVNDFIRESRKKG